MASSSSSTEATPPWLELPREITAAILHKLGAVEILMTAQKVCTAWRSVCEDPSMWRCIDMRSTDDLWEMPYNSDRIYRHAVDRSQGQLIDINIEYFATDDLFMYISQRSSQLRCLQLVKCGCLTSEAVIKGIKNFPQLEELHLHYTYISVEAIETIGRSCPLLKSFKLNSHWNNQQDAVCDLEAQAIAENMPGLHYLQLLGNKMTNEGLQAILEGCPDVQSLDLRRCFNIDFGGNLGRLCSQRIKDLKRPHDHMDDNQFDDEIYDDEISVENCISAFDLDIVSDYDEHLKFSGGSVSSYEYEDELFVD